MKKIITTDAAPAAIGTYSQAVEANGFLFLSGQIPLVPESMSLISEDIEAQLHQVFKNCQAVCQAAGYELADIVKLSIFLTDLGQFATVNTVMSQYFEEPYPARAAFQVSALPKGAQVEIEAVATKP